MEDDCKTVYRAEDTKHPCPRCGGHGTVLVDISHTYGNRSERRRAARAKLPMKKYLECPDCKGKNLMMEGKTNEIN